ncbi:MAG: LamG-like jellyroll fold domain-containing protein [Verrucomicrobiia bacterium]
MKLKKLCYATIVAFLACLIQTVSAQDSHWNGTVTNNLWNNPNNWTPVGVPPPGNPTTTFTGNVWLDPSTNDGDTVITISDGDVETPGVGNSTEVYNTIFGPEFGCTLNIYGTLEFDWTIAPYQPDPTPGLRSHINMYGNAYMYTSGASLNLGSGWWPVCEGAYVTMNLYNNANYSSLGGAGIWTGGHLNIYDTATVLINGYVNINNGQANNDATTVFNVGGGTLQLPEGWVTGANTTLNGGSGTVTNLVARGILRVYGKGYDTNDLVMSDNGTNTIVQAVPLGGALQRVYFQSLAHSTAEIGSFQQATLVGDYPSVSGVLLSSSEPGVDPATFSAPAYTSSNPNVATVDTNGMVTAVGAGSATLTATVGALTSTNSVTITVVPVNATLIHRYSFNETSGTTASDSVGGPAWNGTLEGSGTVFNGTGQVVLTGATNNLILGDGIASYVSLPAGLVSNLSEITIETWASFNPTTTNNFENLFAFGFSDLNPIDGTYGDGGNYVTFSPHTGGATAQLNFGQGVPGNSGERDAIINNTLDGQNNLQVVGVFSPDTGNEVLYTNGVLAVRVSMFNALMDPVAYADPAFNSKSVLAYQLGADANNYLGESLYGTDPGFNGSIDEFRIYNGPLTASQIAADNALGPNQLRGTSLAPVSLSVTRSGGNLVFSWPTSSALVTLVSSPTLGPSAVWTPVALPAGAMAVAGSNYQVTLPMSGSTQFFRLSE